MLKEFFQQLYLKQQEQENQERIQELMKILKERAEQYDRLSNSQDN